MGATRLALLPTFLLPASDYCRQVGTVFGRDICEYVGPSKIVRFISGPKCPVLLPPGYILFKINDAKMPMSVFGRNASAKCVTTVHLLLRYTLEVKRSKIKVKNAKRAKSFFDRNSAIYGPIYFNNIPLF